VNKNYYHLRIFRGYSRGLRHEDKQNWRNPAVPSLIKFDRQNNDMAQSQSRRVFSPTERSHLQLFNNKTERTVTLLDMSLKNVRQFSLVPFYLSRFSLINRTFLY